MQRVMSLPKTHMRSTLSSETLCGRPLFTNAPCVYALNNETFVDCKSCLKVLERRRDEKSK